MIKTIQGRLGLNPDGFLQAVPSCPRTQVCSVAPKSPCALATLLVPLQAVILQYTTWAPSVCAERKRSNPLAGQLREKPCGSSASHAAFQIYHHIPPYPCP